MLSTRLKETGPRFIPDGAPNMLSARPGCRRTPPPAAVMRSSRAARGRAELRAQRRVAEVGDERLDHVHARAAPRADAARERRAQLRRRQRGVRRGREAHRAVGRVEERARRRERVHDVEVDVAVRKHEPLEQGAGLQPFGHARHAHGDLRAVCGRGGDRQKERRGHAHGRHLASSIVASGS